MEKRKQEEEKKKAENERKKRTDKDMKDKKMIEIEIAKKKLQNVRLFSFTIRGALTEKQNTECNPPEGSMERFQ